MKICHICNHEYFSYCKWCEREDMIKKLGLDHPKPRLDKIIDIFVYAFISPLFLIIALPVIIFGILEIVIKKIEPEYFNR